VRLHVGVLALMLFYMNSVQLYLSSSGLTIQPNWDTIDFWLGQPYFLLAELPLASFTTALLVGVSDFRVFLFLDFP
jgi:hypothetical protein